MIILLILLSFLFMEFVALSNDKYIIHVINYFLIHDIVIHQRLPIFKDPVNPYILAITRTHTAHNRPATPQDFKNFRLLAFPKRYFN